MAAYQGFWSYVHADDDAERRRITLLADDIIEQYKMLTGEDINLLFLDTEGLQWGDQWRQEIEASLASVAFFVPVMTPRYFMSPECRRELQFFMRKATDLGVKELILPLHYVNVIELGAETTDDDLIKLLRTFQWEDWRELRFADVTSAEYRRAVAKLAARLVAANQRAEETAPNTPEILQQQFDDNDAPGQIDTLAESEELLAELPQTLQGLTEEVGQIGELMSEAADNTKRLEAQGKGFSARLIIARQLASKLVAPVEAIWSLSNLYASQLHAIDSGFRIIIDRAIVEVKEDSDNVTNYCKFFKSVRGMSQSSAVAIGHMQGMLEAVGPLEQMSRDLRPVLRRLKQGLTILIEASAVTQEWLHLIDSTGIDCEGPAGEQAS